MTTLRTWQSKREALRLASLGLAVIVAACTPAKTPPVPGHEAAESSSANVEIGKPLTSAEARAAHRQFVPKFSAWTEGDDLSHYVYLRMSEFWPQLVMERTGTIGSLSPDPGGWVGDLPVSAAGGETSLADFVDQAVDGLIVVHRGRIIFESYPRMLPSDKHVWFSVSKTIVSLALAILEDRELLDVSRPIDFYLGALVGTAWAGTPIIDILDMASGIDCPEVKEQPDSCFWDFYAAFGWPETGRVVSDPVQTIARMSRVVPPGQEFAYTSVNTEVLNMLVETVSGERFSDFVEREIWQRTGARSDAFITATASGYSFSAGGVSSTLRDLARFGLLFTPTGRTQANPVVSDSYLDNIRNAGRPELISAERRDWWNELLGDNSMQHSSRQWDVVTRDGDFIKSGFAGQGLYVSASNDLVVAWFSTQTVERMFEVIPIARQLSASSLTWRTIGD